MTLLHFLIVAGVVAARKGVVARADASQGLGEFLFGITIRAFEHHVFQRVGDARDAAVFIGRTYFVP